jgi:hypothetical protein
LSSQASSHVEHTSTRLETVPVSLYFIMTRPHFGQMIALVVSAVSTAVGGTSGGAVGGFCVSAQWR